MKRNIQKLNENSLVRDFPIKSLVEGWFFRVIENSANVYFIEGSDLWGRKVELQGTDPDELLSQAALEANKLNKQIQSKHQ